MFSGIVRGCGRIGEVQDRGADRRLTVDRTGVDLGSIAVGDSIAVNGVCLTAAAVVDGGFAADVSAETLQRTTLGRLGAGEPVNLEPSLKLGDAIDGHLVYGHVDGIGEVAALDAVGRSLGLSIRVPAALTRYLAVKGSVAVDGVSLTINAADADRFAVMIVPHTRAATVIAGYRAGTPVNIEIDMIARYLERLIAGTPGKLTRETLKQHGFIEESE